MSPKLHLSKKHLLKTICIVEDISDIRRNLVQKVKAMPNVKFLEEFSNGKDAYNMLPGLAPDLVIMDIGLPKMTGVECLARLKKEGHTMDFIMFTVFDHDKHLLPAIEMGAVGYILKSEGASGVENAINLWLEGGAPMSPAIGKKILSKFQTAMLAQKADFVELSSRENQVLELISKGKINKEIANILGCSESTIKQHNVKIYKKLNVNNRTEAMLKYLES